MSLMKGLQLQLAEQPFTSMVSDASIDTGMYPVETSRNAALSKVQNKLSMTHQARHRCWGGSTLGSEKTQRRALGL
jgi:hypothetical protein